MATGPSALKISEALLPEHVFFLLVATDEDECYDYADKQCSRNANPQGVTAHGQLEEQHREAPAYDCLEDGHERPVELAEFAEGRSESRQAGHVEQDEQQVGEHLEFAEPEVCAHSAQGGSNVLVFGIADSSLVCCAWRMDFSPS